MEAAEQFLHYGRGIFPAVIDPVCPHPIRFALGDVHGAGRILVHSTYVGKDAETSRDGNYFSHALIGSPQEIDPLWALGRWGSSFWKTQDGNGPTDLPEVAREHVPAGPVGESKIGDVVARHGAEVAMLLNFMAVANRGSNFFLAATPLQAVNCMFAALRAVPPRLRDEMSFSTFEPDPRGVPLRIIATCWDSRQSGGDFDPACYNAPTGRQPKHHWVFNPANGKKSLAATATPNDYSAFAFKGLAAGRLRELDRLFEKCDSYGVKDFAGLDYLVRFTAGNSPPAPAELKLPQAVHLALPILEQFPDLVGDLADLAVEDADFQQNVLPVYLTAMVGQPQLTQRWADCIWSRGLATAQVKNFERAKRYWQLKTVPGGAPLPVRDLFLRDIKDPHKLNLETRFYALKQILGGVTPGSQGTEAWTTTTLTDLPGYLNAGIDANWLHTIILNSLARGSGQAIPDSILIYVANKPDLAIRIVGHVGASDLRRGVEIVKAGLARNPSEDWANRVAAQILDASTLGSLSLPGVRDRCPLAGGI